MEKTPRSGRRRGRAADGSRPVTLAEALARIDADQREIRHLREQRDILKKRWAFSPNRRPPLPTDRRDERFLSPSRRSAKIWTFPKKSGYYDWWQRRSTPGPRAQADVALAKTIANIHACSRRTYGSPRIVMELRKQDKHHGRNRVSRLMNEHGLCGRQQARYRVQRR